MPLLDLGFAWGLLLEVYFCVCLQKLYLYIFCSCFALTHHLYSWDSFSLLYAEFELSLDCLKVNFRRCMVAYLSEAEESSSANASCFQNDIGKIQLQWTQTSSKILAFSFYQSRLIYSIMISAASSAWYSFELPVRIICCSLEWADIQAIGLDLHNLTSNTRYLLRFFQCFLQCESFSRVN